MNEKQETVKQTQDKKTAVVKPVSPIELAQAARLAEAARREAMSPRQKAVEDLSEAANRIANLIDTQRGNLLGIVSRGLLPVSQGEGKPPLPAPLKAEEVLRAVAFIQASLDRVKAATSDERGQKAERFSV